MILKNKIKNSDSFSLLSLNELDFDVVDVFVFRVSGRLGVLMCLFVCSLACWLAHIILLGCGH
jgi:hypothetical protein